MKARHSFPPVRPVVCAVALTACVLAVASGPAAADIQVSSNEGPPGQSVPGDAGTLTFSGIGTASLRVEYRPNSHDYVITTTTGVFVMATGSPVDAGIVPLCTGLSTAVLTCPETRPAHTPYRLHFVSPHSPGGNDHPMDVALRGQGNVVTALAYPAPVVIAEASDAGATFENDTGTPVTFTGRDGADTYRTGTGVEQVTMGAGLDTVDYRGYGVTRCVTVTLDGVANDSIRQCSGATQAVTESGENIGADVEKVFGGGGDDSITGTDSVNDFRGGGGFDELVGLGGADQLFGGAGGARMIGGAGADVFDAAPGEGTTVSYADKTAPVTADLDGVADDGTGCPGAGCEGDRIDADVIGLEGGAGDDSLSGAPGGRSLTGGDGGDTLLGGSGDDTMRGQGGNDDINAFGGTDTIAPGPGVDTYEGGPGLDTLDYSESTADLSISIAGGSGDGEGGLENVLTTIEDVRTGSGNDTVTGDGDANKLFGNGGDDVLDGAGGNDTLTANGFAIGTSQAGDGGCDVSRGGAGDDSINIFPLNPPGTPCRDAIDYSDHATGVTVTLAATTAAGQGSPGENDSFRGDFVDVIGTDQADTIAVTTAPGEHTLDGRGSADTLTGGAADDTLLGGLGNDNLTGGAGSDTIDGGTGANVAEGGDGDDDITGGPSGGNVVDAGTGADSMKVRNSALDTVQCGADVDTVVADEVDVTGGDCESVDRGVPPPAPGPGAQAPPPAGGTPPPGGGTPPPGGGTPAAGGDAPPPGTGSPPPAGPPAVPPDTVAQRVAVGPRKVRLSAKGVATLTLTCPRTEVSCSGTVSLATAKKVTRAGQPKSKATRVTFGSKRFAMKGGASVKVAIKLKRADLSLVKRLKRLAVRATADARDAAGNRATTAAALTLELPRPR